jgi:hypothetical protein
MPHEPWNHRVEPSQRDFLNLLQQISASLAQLVLIQQARLALEQKDMPPNVIQALIDLLNKFVALVQAQAGDAAALKAAQDSLAALQASDASATALVPSAQAAIDAANAALPPAPAPTGAP